MSKKRIAIPDFNDYKEAGRKLAMITAYDYSTARIAAAAGADMLLVGDSLGNVVLGYESTAPVTLQQMVEHCRAVKRGADNCLVICDMPFGTYEVSREQALQSAITLMKEGGADAVKLEGGSAFAPVIKTLTLAGIPVFGHIGLTPQTLSQLGGHRVQGKTEESALSLLEAAQDLEEAGTVAIVLECITQEVAAKIDEALDIPTIGIGSGPDCSGQVLVFHDVVGINDTFKPHFVKQYMQGAQMMKEAISSFCQEVRSGAFPTLEYSFQMEPEERKKID